MTGLLTDRTAAPANPLDLIEEFARSNEWSFERSGAEELVVDLGGRWCDYSLFFAWHAEISVMQFCCACELRVPDPRRAAVRDLVSLVNDKLCLGYFATSTPDNHLMFRHSVLLGAHPGGAAEQMEGLLDIALAECERYYPAFQFVIWGGRPAHEAIAAALLDTVGEA